MCARLCQLCAWLTGGLEASLVGLFSRKVHPPCSDFEYLPQTQNKVNKKMFSHACTLNTFCIQCLDYKIKWKEGFCDECHWESCKILSWWHFVTFSNLIVTERTRDAWRPIFGDIEERGDHPASAEGLLHLRSAISASQVGCISDFIRFYFFKIAPKIELEWNVCFY